MQWIEGVKLTTLAPQEIRDLVKVGQEAFLVQLLEVRKQEKAWKATCGEIRHKLFSHDLIPLTNRSAFSMATRILVRMRRCCAACFL